MSLAQHKQHFFTDNRLTPVREALYDFFVSQPTGTIVTPASCRQHLHRHNITCDRSTLYRELLFFVDQSLLQQLPVGGKTTYEVLGHSHHHHAHAICDDCHAVVHVDLPASVQRQIERLTQFQHDTGSLTITGQCKHCQ